MRCDRASLIGRSRCDHPATENGRCALHNHPFHAKAPHYSAIRKPKPPKVKWRVTNQRTGEVREVGGRSGFDAVKRAFPGHYIQTSSVDELLYKVECLSSSTVLYYRKSNWC